MSVLELKGGILELVSRLNDEASLTSIYEAAEAALRANRADGDWFDNLPAEAQQELTESVRESEQEDVLYTAEQAQNHLAEWRK